jgi:hypothetical protein
VLGPEELLELFERGVLGRFFDGAHPCSFRGK